MLRNEVLALMEALKLRGMQEVYDELLASGRRQRAIPEKVVLELLKAEAGGFGFGIGNSPLFSETPKSQSIHL